MAAGLTDHVWSTREWITFPAGQRREDTTELPGGQGIDTACVVIDDSRSTTTKTRLVAHSQRMVRTATCGLKELRSALGG